MNIVNRANTKMTNCIEMDTNMDKLVEKPVITVDILKAQANVNRLVELKIKNLTKQLIDNEITQKDMFVGVYNIADRIKEITSWAESINENIKANESRVDNLSNHVMHILGHNLKPIDKKQGLTFEQAITAFKHGKKIRLSDGISCGVIYNPKYGTALSFEYADMQRDHWEIVD